MPSLARDVRLAARRLLRAPGLVAIILLTVGAGTGANAVVVSATRALLFDPPPGVADPDSLVEVFAIDPRGGYVGVTPSMVEALGASDRVDGIAALEDRGQAVVNVGPRLADLATTAAADGSFEVLGLQPAAGRFFDADYARDAVAVIAFDLWAGNARGIGRLEVGDRVEVLGDMREVVGVMPPGFLGLRAGLSVGVWVPMPERRRDDGRLPPRWTVVARAPGIQPDDLAGLEDTIAAASPEAVEVVPYSRLDPGVRPRVVRIAFVLFGATLLVLIVACVNAGAMVLSRGMARVRELAIRQSLGAGPRHLVRELLSESLCLALGAAAVGLIFTAWASSIVPSMLGLERDALPVAGRTTLMAIGAAVLIAGGLLSIGPLIQGLRPAALASLRSSGGAGLGTHGASTRATLVVTQVALSCVLLVLSIVFTATLRDALWAYPTVPIREFASLGIRTGGSLSRLAALEAAAAELELTGEAAWITTLPGAPPILARFELSADGRAAAQGAPQRDLPVAVVSNDYFDVARLPIVRGRGFLPGDSFRAPLVAVINDVMARVLFDGEPIGQQIVSVLAPRRTFTVVGVVASRQYRTLEGPPRPLIYYTAQQMPANRMVFVAPAIGRPQAAADAIASDWLEAGLVGEREFEWASSMDVRLAAALPADRLTTTLLRTTTMLAMVLIMVGVYGVMADTVTRRQREIGVCAALGAGPSRIVALAMSGGVRLAAIGVAAGLAGGAGAWQLLSAVLEGTGPLEPRAFATTIAVVIVMAIAAAVVPAQRALRVDPLVVMRDE